MNKNKGQPMTGHGMNKVAIASFVGALLEWYGFCIFGTASAAAFGLLFFPNQNPLNDSMGAFAR
jgi:MFS transporter, MHS family, shikimate and dehydroshikimate transport protein